ncbi:MAG: outer membrane lipoprotein-sorting protein [Candidatus Marinimicrobia bacterium]|nr:outer membrane lipoprotein-sorting protein [Candidatus Neomarinimicrobiota bacterium]
MRKIIIFIISVFYFSIVLSQTGREIMEKVDKENKYKTAVAKSRMILINKRGQKRERTVVRFEEDYEKGDVDKKTLVVFDYPNDIRGTALLVWSYNIPSKDDDRWLYLPAVKRVKRIAGKSKSEYFMGTDFTYDDLGGRSLDEDKFELIGKEVIDSVECFKIEAIPLEKEPTYSKRILWVLPEKWVIKRVDYFDNNGNLLKRMVCDRLENANGRWLYTKLQMNNIQKKHKTIIEIEDIAYDKPLEENIFTVSMLESGRILLLGK